MTNSNLRLPESGLVSPGGYVSGRYYFCSSPNGVVTSSTLGEAIARVTAWAVAAPLPLAALFVEFTNPGHASSVFRIGIWHDDGFGRPGRLLLDAGTISTGSGNAGTIATGGTPGVYELPVSKTLRPDLYWIGGAVQGSAGVQPTMRCVGPSVQCPGGPFTSLPVAAASVVGMAFTDTDAFEATAPSPGPSGSAARIGFKVAA